MNQHEQNTIRLADRIMAGCKIIAMPDTAATVAAATMKNIISESQIIDITNVADYYEEHIADSGKAPFEAFPNIAPVFTKFFMEMRPNSATCLTSAGVAFTAKQISRSEAETEYRNGPAGKRGMQMEWIHGIVSPEEDVWRMDGIGVGYNKDGCIPLFFTTALVSMRGQIATRYNPLFSLQDKSMTESALSGFSSNILNPAYLALSFLHCKNIKLSPNEPPAKLSKAFQRRHGRPLLRYHTLEIEPMKKVLETEGGIGHNGLKKALHICRGHFATYTPEKPLFGRVTGTVWKPAHVRGSVAEGIVAKDYSIKAPV